MATSFKLNKLWDAKSLKINGSTVEATGIINSLDGVALDSTALVTAGGIKAAIESIDKANLSYKYVESLPADKDLEENTIYIVPSSENATDNSKNLCTEWLCYGVETEEGRKLTLEKIGEVGFDYSAVSEEIEAAQDAADTAQAGVDAINEALGAAYDKDSTVAAAIADAKKAGTDAQDTANTAVANAATAQAAAEAAQKTADEALQGVSSTAVSGDDTHGVSFTLTENATSHELEGSVGVTAATLTDGAFGTDDTKLTQAKDVQSAIATAITAEDNTVDAKSVAMASMEGDVTADAKVKVAITGTIKEHSIAVTTNDIASAATLSALDTYIKGEKAEGQTTGAIEARLAVVEESIGGGTQGIGTRVTALETLAGTGKTLDTTAKNLVEAVNEVKGTADAALQGVNTVTATGSHGLALSASEDDSHNLTVGLAVEAATQNDDSKVLSTDNFATGAQVESRVTKAVATVQGVQMPGAKSDAGNFVTVTLGGTVAAPTLTVATNDIAKASELTQEIADRKSGDAALVASVTGDLTTGTASEIVKVIASTAAGNEENGTGKAVTLHTQVTTASTTTTDNKTVINTSIEGALVTAKAAQDAIDAAEARAKSAQTYTADEVTIHVENNAFSAKTAAVAANATTLTTGGQVHAAIEAAKTALIGDANTADTIKKAQKTAEDAQATADGKVSSVAVSDITNFSSTASTDNNTYTISVVENSPLDVLIKAFTTAADAVKEEGENTFAARLTKLFQLADELKVS